MSHWVVWGVYQLVSQPPGWLKHLEEPASCYGGRNVDPVWWGSQVGKSTLSNVRRRTPPVPVSADLGVRTHAHTQTPVACTHTHTDTTTSHTHAQPYPPTHREACLPHTPITHTHRTHTPGTWIHTHTYKPHTHPYVHSTPHIHHTQLAWDGNKKGRSCIINYSPIVRKNFKLWYCYLRACWQTSSVLLHLA